MPGGCARCQEASLGHALQASASCVSAATMHHGACTCDEVVRVIVLLSILHLHPVSTACGQSRMPPLGCNGPAHENSCMRTVFRFETQRGLWSKRSSETDAAILEDWQIVATLNQPEEAIHVSFDQLFRLYRGLKHTDDFETLSCSAAHTCNRLHGHMAGAACSPSTICMHRAEAPDVS